MPTLNQQVANATKWSAITEVMGKLVAPVSSMILARLLTPDAFGVVATLNMVIAFAEIFTDAGFQKYLIQQPFKDADDRRAAPTDYALKNGAAVSDDCKLANGMKTGWWWLRSPASSSNRAADADCFGNIDTVKNADGVDGDIVFAESNCVRPVVWIKLADSVKEVG